MQEPNRTLLNKNKPFQSNGENKQKIMLQSNFRITQII